MKVEELKSGKGKEHRAKSWKPRA